MKLALLGTGMIVTEVLPVLTTIEGIELKAIMSTPRSLDKAKALAKQYGLAQATSDYEEILSNPEVDTIYVGTPNHTHLFVRNLSPYIWKSLKSWLSLRKKKSFS